MNKSLKAIFKIIIAILLGALFVYLGMKFITQTYGASPVWPATGLFAFFVFELGIMALPVSIISYAIGQFLHGAHFETIYLGMIGAGLETFIFYLFKEKLFNPKEVKFLGQKTVNLFFISLFGGFCSALLGISELYRLGFIKENDLSTSFFSWMIGNVLGFLFITPSLILIKNIGIKNFLKNLIASYRSILIITTFLIVIFYFPIFNPTIFLIFFGLIIVAAVDGRKGVITSSLIVYLFSITMTYHGLSPFSSGTQTENLIALQILLLSFSILGFGLSEIKFRYFSKSLKISVSLISILFSIVYFYLYKSEVKKDEIAFREKTELFKTNLYSNFETYANFLQSAESFYEVKKDVSEVDWKNYVSNLSLTKSYPGINGMGLIEYVPKTQLAQFLSNEVKNRPNFKIRYIDNNQKGNVLGDHYIIKYIEPISTNQLALGLDLSSEPTREAAAFYSKNSGKISMSDPIYLVQDKIKKPGFLMLIPMFNQNPKSTQGWIYAPFKTDQFVKPALGVLKNEVEIEISDVNQSLKKEIIFENLNQFRGYRPLKRKTEISFGNNSWQIEFFSTPMFVSERWRISAWIMVLSTITMLIIIIGLSIMENSKKDAQQMAQVLSEKLLQSSKLSALGEMAAGIAHEINNPLMIIKGKTELLLKKLQKNDSIEADSIDKMNTIISTTDRISLIIRGLKQFSRDSETDPFETENLKDIIDDTLNFCRDRFKQNNVNLIIGPMSDLKINCRRIQIEQVLVNILNNALDASEGFSERWVKLEVGSDQENITISVINSGAKIPENIAAKIMEPFFTTKPVGKGTGLGLSISRNIMAAHKGGLILNQAYENTCFDIIIPRTN